VEIEVHAGWGNTDKIAVVGLPDTAVKESKDRVTSAICNSGLHWPYEKRITINLAPADVRKEGPSFDLPIALGMLKLEENNRLPALDAFCITGELALSGQLRPVKGVFSIALEAKRRSRQTLIVPHDHGSSRPAARTLCTTLTPNQLWTLATILPRTCPSASRSNAFEIASNVICSATVGLIFPTCTNAISSVAVRPKSSCRRRNAGEARTPPKPIS